MLTHVKASLTGVTRSFAYGCVPRPRDAVRGHTRRHGLSAAVAALVLSTVCPGSGQQLELGGYYENQFTPQEIGGGLVLQDRDRLRLDLFSQVDDRVVFAGDVVWQVYHGATELNALDLLPGSVVEAHAADLGVSAWQLRPLYYLAFEDEHFIDNAHVTVYLGRLSLRVGAQQLPWGTGYTWNPTDVFHDKSFLDPTYERKGIDALVAESTFGAEGRITGVLSVGSDWSHTARALKIRDHIRGWDLSAVAVQEREQEVDHATGTESRPRRRLLGGDVSGQAAGVGIWGEGARNWVTGSRGFVQYVVGLDHTTLGGTYLLAEYYHNGRGRSGEANYSIGDWMRLLGARGENLGRDYLSVGLSRPARELWTLSMYAIANLSDCSLVAFPWVEYNLGDNTEVDATAYLPLGGALTEFGASGYGGLARLRVYF